MVANISFNVKVFLENAGVLPELHARMADLSPAFQAIYGEWVKINIQKFSLSKNEEAFGADIFGEEWAAVTPGYFKQKHGSGEAVKGTRRGAKYEGHYPDWLMVRSGALKAAMTNPDALFQHFEAQMAQFGIPNDPDLADIVMWQAGARQKERFVVFLSDPDVNAIRRILQDYFGMGGNFAEMRFAAGMQALANEREIGQMDAEFNVAAAE